MGKCMFSMFIGPVVGFPISSTVVNFEKVLQELNYVRRSLLLSEDHDVLLGQSVNSECHGCTINRITILSMALLPVTTTSSSMNIYTG